MQVRAVNLTKSAGEGAQRRTWRAAQVHGLLPNPFPMPASTRERGRIERGLESMMGALARVPLVAWAASRRAGDSMVVVTEYGFDVASVRAAVGPGPEVVAVHVGTGGSRPAWGRLPLAGDLALHLHDDGPVGITRVVLAGRARTFSVGDVQFEVQP
ncbi:MAG TPA: hypothetical protein VGJ70_03110 [Solirubrobacteraceae bacterium]